METVDELLEQAESQIQVATVGKPICLIDESTRVVTIPLERQLVGVESDEKVERLYFQCPKIVGDNIDLSKLRLYAIYRNASGEKDADIITDMQVAGDNIEFSWCLPRKFTKYRGNVAFIISAEKVQTDGKITNEWNTELNFDCYVKEGLEVDIPPIEESQMNIITQLLEVVDQKSKEAVAAVEQARANAIKQIGTITVPSVTEDGILYFDVLT